MQCIDVQYIVLILAWMFFNNVPEIRLQQVGFWGNYWGRGRETYSPDTCLPSTLFPLPSTLKTDKRAKIPLRP